ncbi:hypothetical protein QVD17_06582 [Tagetes erecta]|uniref:Uncharacterized protein n=1 Tax=Tagetes erecta TaxID=13708 RepID=A0AAD8LKG6_TARER|nr:hypothetical protein QVD17_06582 [Tagetes erecta]
MSLTSHTRKRKAEASQIDVKPQDVINFKVKVESSRVGGYEGDVPDEFKLLTGRYAWKLDVSKYNTNHGSVTYGIIKYSNDLVITIELDDHFADDKVADTPTAHKHSNSELDQKTPSDNAERDSVMDDNTTPNETVDKSLGKRLMDGDVIDLVEEDRYSMKRNLKDIYDVDESVDGSSSKPKKYNDLGCFLIWVSG